MEKHTSPDVVIYVCIFHVECVLKVGLYGHAFNDTKAHNAEI